MVYDDADEDLDLELLNGANPDSMWCPDTINDCGDLSLGVVSPSGPLYMCPEYLGPPSGPGYMVPPFGPGYFESTSGPELQYLGPYYSSNYPNMMILNDSRQLMENNNVELLPRLMDIRFPQTVVDNFSMTNGNIAMVGVKSKVKTFQSSHF